MLPTGTEIGLDELTAAEGAARGRDLGRRAAGRPAPPSGPTPLMADAARLEAAFDAALAARDVAAAVNAVLELDRTLVAWSADTTAVRRARPGPGHPAPMIVRLGELAALGARDPRRGGRAARRGCPGRPLGRPRRPSTGPLADDAPRPPRRRRRRGPRHPGRPTWHLTGPDQPGRMTADPAGVGQAGW